MDKQDDNKTSSSDDRKTGRPIYINKKTAKSVAENGGKSNESESNGQNPDALILQSDTVKTSQKIEKSELKADKTDDKGDKSNFKGDKNDQKGEKTDLKGDKPSDVKDEKKQQARKKRNLWSIKITVISLFLSAFISFLSELTASSEHIIVTVLLLLFLILTSVLFDGIGVAAASCDITPFVSMASRKVYGAKTAMWLVKNNEKVSNVCNDVIGDIFGIISGACSAAIVLKLVTVLNVDWQRWLTIGISSVVAALTIGGKAFLKKFAINNSREFVFFISRILAVFNPEERKRKKKQNAKKKKFEEMKRVTDLSAENPDDDYAGDRD